MDPSKPLEWPLDSFSAPENPFCKLCAVTLFASELQPRSQLSGLSTLTDANLTLSHPDKGMESSTSKHGADESTFVLRENESTPTARVGVSARRGEEGEGLRARSFNYNLLGLGPWLIGHCRAGGGTA